MKKIAIIGGGAAGYFVAANLGKKLGKQTVIFEQANTPLQKVRISGGGRCNVTHACFDPLDLVEFYPRGKKELLSVFYVFQPSDTMAWFEERRVQLKIEEDNRIFPTSNSSLSIINTLIEATENNNIQYNFSEGIQEIIPKDNGYELVSKTEKYFFEAVIITTGSTPKFWNNLKNLGLKIVNPVPSLFTFNCKDTRIKELMGISFEEVSVKVHNQKLNTEGPLLITHWGFSGPAILRLSSFGALKLSECNYTFKIEINFINQSNENAFEFLTNKKKEFAKKNTYKNNPFNISKRFWISILKHCQVSEKNTFADLSKKQIGLIVEELTAGIYQINGKSTFKEEFVTAGGVDLKEINFSKMNTKKYPNLYMAGEVLNIDAITGGFNFQACWSEAFIIAEELKKTIL